MSKTDMAGCWAPLKVLTKITFVDGTQLAVVGLDEILAERYAEGRQFWLDV